jgi:hypothetical protein
MKHLLALASVGLVACGGGGGGGTQTDAPSGSTIKISGTAVEVSAAGSKPLLGVAVGAFAATNESTPVATAMTDANGNYTLMVPSTGGALDGFLKATKDTYMDTYLYSPAPLAADFDKAAIKMVTPSTFSLLAGPALCNGMQDMAKGTIAVLVQDAAGMTVGGATIASTPAATKYCFNGTNGLPSGSAMMTAMDGIGYMFNVTGDATVSATKAGITFKSHGVKARANTLTTTLIQP